MHVFISGLFLYVLQVYPYLKGTFGEPFPFVLLIHVHIKQKASHHKEQIQREHFLTVDFTVFNIRATKSNNVAQPLL